MDIQLEKLLIMIISALSHNLVRLAVIGQETEKEQEEVLQKLIKDGCIESREMYKSLPYQLGYSATCEFVAYLSFLLRFDEKIFDAVKEIDPATYKYIKAMKLTGKRFNTEKNDNETRH